MGTGREFLTPALAAGAVLLLSICGALARCSVPSFNFTFGEPGSAGMTATSGEPCNIKLRESAVSVFKATSLSKRPAKGSVAIPSPINVTYRSRPGQKGEDSFVIRISGTRSGVPRTTELTVAVLIQEPGDKSFRSAPTPPPRSSRSRTTAGTNALQAKCLKDVGAGRDPVTGQMSFYINHPSRMDQFKLCLAGGDREKAKTITVPELQRTHPGDRGPMVRQ
jgi:hypothetical protein